MMMVIIIKSPLPASAGGPIMGDGGSKAGGDKEPATRLPIPDLIIVIIVIIMAIMIMIIF